MTKTQGGGTTPQDYVILVGQDQRLKEWQRWPHPLGTINSETVQRNQKIFEGIEAVKHEACILNRCFFRARRKARKLLQ